jgi:hypothetical protein
MFTNGQEGAVSGAMNAIPNTTRTGNYIGRFSDAAELYFEGEIAELILFDTLISDATSEAIEAYLENRYDITVPAPPAPLFALPSSTLTRPQAVAICGSANGTVYLTNDGTAPTTGSTVYNAPLEIMYSQTIKAIDVVDGQSSGIAIASYILDPSAFPAPDTSDANEPVINITLPAFGQ